MQPQSPHAFAQGATVLNVYQHTLYTVQQHKTNGLSIMLNTETGIPQPYNSHNNAHFISPPAQLTLHL